MSFSGDLCVTEEEVRESGKDTSRMLAAGANRVFWIRVLHDKLDLGATAIKDLLTPGSVTVCESNSMRLVAEPDLFFIVRRTSTKKLKPSSLKVAPFADDVVEFDASQFQPSPERISFAFEHWTYKREATAIVMAGGQSRRMGCEKAMLPIEGEPMISRIVRQLRPWFDQVLISASAPDAFAFLGLEVVPDEVSGAGPLMALASALEKSTHDINFVVPCDMPEVPQQLLAQLLRESRDADIVVPETEGGELEPLFAAYRRSVLPSARAALARGERRVISCFGGHKVKRLPLQPGTLLNNLNTMEEYLSRTNRSVTNSSMKTHKSVL